MTRPVSYLTYEVASNDGNKHNVELYFEAGRSGHSISLIRKL